MQRIRQRPYRLLLSAASLWLMACGADNSMDSAASKPTNAGGTAPPPQATDAGSAEKDASDAAAPEQEEESSYQSPVATGKIVWIANPQTGQVAYVDAITLEVRTIAAGNRPTFMAAIPSVTEDSAVVVNALSHDLTILRAQEGKSATATTLGITAGANSIAVSPDGKWAIAWTDARKEEGATKLKGYQDLTVVNLTQGKESAYRLSVGYRPIAVSVSSSSKTAYAVTQDGISVIDLPEGGAARVQRLVELSANPLEDPGSRDVGISPDGSTALVRRDGEAKLDVIALDTGTIVPLVLPGPCTDLDLSSDGKTALAAIRSTGDVAVIHVANGIASGFDLVHIDKATVGSIAIASNAQTAVLYTNASAEERVTRLGFGQQPAEVTTIKLHAAAKAVFPSDNGSSALVLHQSLTGSEGAYSIVALAQALPAKIVEAFAPITAVAQSPDGLYAALSERSDKQKVYGVHVVQSKNQKVDHFELASPPISVGIMTAAHRAFVAQEHTEGRITFIDLESGVAKTLTGFELAARVVDGSKP